ncbi:MAG: efflux RND transporter periplasmic adaptor subunit [Anaerolineae bacterium]|nr:efflux RND transporter periplasmic adaptor subunit [Anaerolineae bacterium]
MPPLRKSLRLWTVLFLALALGCSCSANATSEETESLELVTVERGSLATSITATGSVYPKDKVTLSFEIGGRIAEVHVAFGDAVTAGQILAELDTTDLELQVRSAEAGLAAAQAQLAQLQEGPVAEEIAAAEGQLEAAQAALSQAIAQRDQLTSGATEADIAAAESQVAAAMAEQKAALHLHNKTMECQTIELPDGTEKRICPTLGDPEEEARYRLNAANEALAAAEAQLAAVTAGIDARTRNVNAAVWAAVAQRDVTQAQLDLLKVSASEAQIAAAEANVAQAEIALDTAQVALERAYLRAPMDGVVSEANVRPGEFVSQQVSAFVIVDDQHFEVKGDIDEADIGFLTVGTPVRLTLDALPGHDLTGEVTVIAPSATFDVGLVSYEVTVEIDETDLVLRDGMTANMEIIREERTDVVLVPNIAVWIDSDTGRQFVERQSGETIEIAYIEQGISNDQFSEVISGVEAGDRLVLRSSSIRDRFREVMTASMTGGE